MPNLGCCATEDKILRGSGFSNHCRLTAPSIIPGNDCFIRAVFESDCHLALEFGTTRMTCYMATQVHLSGSLTPSQMSDCACACVRVCTLLRRVHWCDCSPHQVSTYQTVSKCSPYELWGVSISSTTTTQYSLISITLCPKCFEHTQVNPKTEPLSVQCNMWHFIKAGGKSKYS